MALARIRRGESGINYWPGFVDALSTLILSIIFILTVFVVVQFYLQQEVAGKDTALTRLNAQIAQLTELLSMEKSNKANLEDQLAQLRASLATAQSERDKLQGEAQGAGAGLTAAQGRASELAGQIEGEKKISAKALAQVEILNQQIAALRRQLAALVLLCALPLASAGAAIARQFSARIDPVRAIPRAGFAALTATVVLLAALAVIRAPGRSLKVMRATLLTVRADAPVPLGSAAAAMSSGEFLAGCEDLLGNDDWWIHAERRRISERRIAVLGALVRRLSSRSLRHAALQPLIVTRLEHGEDPPEERKPPDPRGKDFFPGQDAGFGEGLAEGRERDVPAHDGGEAQQLGGFLQQEQLIRIDLEFFDQPVNVGAVVRLFCQGLEQTGKINNLHVRQSAGAARFARGTSHLQGLRFRLSRQGGIDQIHFGDELRRLAVTRMRQIDVQIRDDVTRLLIHDDDPVGEGDGFLDVMSYHQDGFGWNITRCP